MTVQVHNGPELNETDTDLANCEILTVDAAGQERWYRIKLTPDDTFDDGYLMAGSRIDGEQADERSPTPPSQLAWDAAREHFRDKGYEVHEA